MTYEAVDIYVKDTTGVHAPIAGAVVAIYSSDGALFYTRAETGADGKASFLLNTQAYSLRFFKAHVGFAQPQLIEVVAQPSSAGSPNVFDVYGEVLVPPISPDPNLCRASGYFRDVSGSPKRYLDIHFIARFNPLLLDGAAVVTERQCIRTDEDGYAQIDLIRFGQYCVMIQDNEDTMRSVFVPDLASVNLPDLLFPRVGRVSLSPAGPYALYVEGSVSVVPTVVTTAGVTLEQTAISDVDWGSSDDAVATVAVDENALYIVGVGSGEANVVATRRDTTIISLPDTPVEVLNGIIRVH